MLEFLLGLASLSGVTAFFAFLLEAADAYFSDYGECSIDINAGEKKLEVEGGGKLLSLLMDEGIFIPSACGGRGSCGLCKVKILDGGGPILPTETPYMSQEELKEQIRLACQVRVRNDLFIEIPAELFLIKLYKTKVIGLRDLTHAIKEVHLQLIEPPTIQFKPGQYIQLEIPEYEKSPEPIYRAYSIASSPSTASEIKLFITRVPEGLATTYIHDFLKVGDEMTFNGPYGEFYLRESDREIIMIATGSGLAPIMSILYQMAEENITRKSTLFFGTRTRRDLFCLKELEELKTRLADFVFVPVLSAPLPEDDWQGEVGIVTNVMLAKVDNFENKEFYLCGHPLMIESVTKLLTQNGVPEDRIFYDKFS